MTLRGKLLSLSQLSVLPRTSLVRYLCSTSRCSSETTLTNQPTPGNETTPTNEPTPRDTGESSPQWAEPSPLNGSGKQHSVSSSVFYSSTPNGTNQTSTKFKRWYQPKFKPIRSLLYVPGSSTKMITNAWTLEADSIVLDLEDSVHQSEKEKALDHIVDALASMPKHPTAEIAVRVNSGRGGAIEKELKALAKVSSAIDVIVFPKFTLSHFRSLATFIQNNFTRPAYNYRIYGLIETPFALESVYNNMIDHLRRDTFQPKLDGFIFGAEDYARMTGIKRSSSLMEIMYARQRVVAVSKAFNLQCFDLVSTSFRDIDMVRAECEQGAAFGFTGKQAIHPSQIPIINETFSPSKDEVNYAAGLLSQYIVERSTENRGAWEFNGKMIDVPVLRSAKRTLYLGSNWNIEKDTADRVLTELSQVEGTFEIARIGEGETDSK